MTNEYVRMPHWCVRDDRFEFDASKCAGYSGVDLMEMRGMRRDTQNGNGMAGDALIPAMALMHKCEYRAKAVFDDGHLVRVFKTQAAALEWAKKHLSRGGEVEIKRVFIG